LNFYRNSLESLLRIACLFLISLVVSHSGSALASDEGQPAAQYLRQRWGAQEGLSGSPNTIAQTPDGYLWVGTDNGLLRFDGQRWLAMKPDEKSLGPIGHVIALTLDGEGALWIWMEGTRILKYKSGHFLPAVTSPLDERAVTALVRGSRGSILLSRAGQHIGRFSPNGVEELGKSPGPVVFALAETPDGKVWVGTRDIGLYYLDAQKAIPLNATLPDNKINCLLAGKQGRLWIGTDKGLSMWDGTKLVTEPMPPPLREAQIRALVEDREGNLWVGTEQGLIRFDGRNASVMPGEASAVTSLFTDREGNIWFSDAHGVERLRHSIFIDLSKTEGFPHGATGPIFPDASGRIWFAMKNGGLYYLQNGQITQITQAGLASDIVYSISVQKDDIWLGRQRGGLTHLHLESGAIQEETFHPGGPFHKDVVYSVHVNRDGSVWAGTLAGDAIHVVNGKLTRLTTPDDPDSGAINAIEEGADGTMWFATSSRLRSFSANRWHSYFERDGLPSAEVICLLQDGSRGLWIGTNYGLAHLANGKIAELSRKDPLLDGAILGMAKDRSGLLWASKPDKVFRIDPNSLLDSSATAIKGRSYGTSDGMLSRGGVRRNQSVVADAQGRIWLSTTSGLSVVDSTIASTRPEPTIAHIQSVRIDGTAHSLVSDKDLNVSAGHKRIEFSFVGLNFSAPETVRYRYRLDRFDPGWSEPNGQRSAVYTNLSPGSYTFHVAATNQEGGWSDREASIPLTVEPLLWQRPSFLVACGLAVLLLALLLYQLRINQMIKRANLIFEERLAERTRIAQELHDTLLQGFFGASMQLSVVAEKVPVGSAARLQLNRIIEVMGIVLDDGRNAVQGLRTERVNAMWLEDAIRTVFRDMDMGQEDSTRQSIEVSGIPRELRPGIQDEICRIVQEAVGNAYKHAQASRITVTIAYSSANLKVQVRDDGRGIDPLFLTEGRYGHWGLLGMRERAARLGAKLQIESKINEGTSITLSVPGQIAFRRYSDNPLVNGTIGFFRSRISSKYPLVPTDDVPSKSK
jgi:signal transduction histidine kinase/ligand-binding sensor domain-containing protein